MKLLSLSSILVLFFPINTFNQIEIVASAAIIDNQFELRKKQYIYSLEVLNNFGYEPYIVEACLSSGPSFLDQYCSKVYYAHTNDSTLRNKGVNEARSLLAFFDQCNFKDDDMIIKITGRYFFENDFFIKLVESTPEIDAIARGWGQADPSIAIFTGCFAMRYKHFKKMIKEINFERMEAEWIDIERIAARYLNKIIKEEKAKVLYIDKIFMGAHIFYGGTVEVNISHF